MKLSRLIKLTGKAAQTYDWRRLAPGNWRWPLIVYPFRAILHPVTTFQEIKYEGKGSPVLGLLIFLLLFLSRVFSYLETGFPFNYRRLEQMNLWVEFMSGAMPALLWCVTNWAICTLMDGEGKFSEIWTCTAYSFFPVVLAAFFNATVSNVLIADEGVFLSVLEGGALLLTLLMLFISSMIVHQYTFKKTVISMLLTVCGIAAVIFLLILALSMFQQLGTFLSTVFKEIFQRVRGG